MSAPATTSSYQIRNHAALAAFAKKFSPAIAQEAEAPVPPSSADFFAEMNMPNNIELDDAAPATIDIQPDFRFIFSYICFYVSNLYPELNVKGHPAVSPLSYVAYCQALVFAHILVCDLSARRTTSWYALPFRNDAHLKDYLSTLLNAKIPSFLMPILEQLAPTLDPRRIKIEFIPSLAGFSFPHDYGRFIPVHVMLAAHQQIATLRANMEPADALLRLYQTHICTFGADLFRIGNLFGTHYNDGANDVTHSNWINQILEYVYNPVVGRALTQKPTFARILLEPYVEANVNDFNPYVYALSATDENVQIMSDFIRSLSRFVSSEDSKTYELGSLLQKIQGITILNHSIEPVTLPTWTKKVITSTTTAAPTRRADARTFATTHNFLALPKVFTGTKHFPDDPTTIDTALYLVRNHTFEPNARNDTYIQFNGKEHISPYVLYFQPYDVSPSSLGYTVALGIKIELAEIDGFTIPAENPKSSLEENNSQFMQSALRLDKVRAVHFDATAVRLRQRRILDNIVQAIGLAFTDMANVILPVFGNNAVRAGNNPPRGFNIQANHNDPDTAFTYTAYVQNEEANIPDGYTYGWSSYRVVTKYRAPANTDKFMLMSFRPLYGLNVTLSRSKNPATLLPK
jgi:hypothetical protein